MGDFLIEGSGNKGEKLIEDDQLCMEKSLNENSFKEHNPLIVTMEGAMGSQKR